ncbi:hypothetical protein EG68_06138 [Paragonimus skrjabini miyazakii]|uniref:Uncharacterized protein n=1 Tax=Paragonimus skrjabini miyazakii TaxID=59628 RepID=A0A8S9YA87_9TREM|nr:hypothetical protein EG68_06138 [Paragonimus skrjabini miyazakii]
MVTNDIAGDVSFEFEGIFAELIRCIDDPSESVCEAVHESLVQFGLRRPEQMILYCFRVIESQRNELACNHILINRHATLLSVIDTILVDKIAELDIGKLPSGFTKTMCSLLLNIKDSNKPQLLKLISNILVHLSSVSYKCVMENLLTLIVDGQGLNTNIMFVSGNIVVQHPENIMHILPVLLSQTMKYLSEPIDDTTRTSLIVTLGHYCDAILDLLSPHTCSVVLGILPILSSSKNAELLSAVLFNVGSIFSLTESDFTIVHLPKLLSLLTGHLKKSTPTTELAIIHSLNILFANLFRRYSPIAPLAVSDSARSSTESSQCAQLGKLFESELDSLMGCLFNQLLLSSQRPSQPNGPDETSLTSKRVNEVKRAFALLCTHYPERVLHFTQSHLHSGPELSRAITMELLRHLIASCDQTCFNPDLRLFVLTNLRHLLFQAASASPPTIRHSSFPKQNLMGSLVKASPLGRDQSGLALGEVAAGSHLPASLRYELVKLVSTLGGAGYLTLDGGQHTFLEFIIRQCAMPLTGSDKASSTGPSQLEIRHLCARVLKLCSLTVPSMQPLMWPFVLEFVTMPECTEAIGVLCECIAHLTSKLSLDLKTGEQELANGHRASAVDMKQLSTTFTPHRLLARLLVLLGHPTGGDNRGFPILRAMHRLASLFHTSLPPIWDLVIPRMIIYLAQDPDDSTQINTVDHNEQPFSQTHWEHLTQKLLSKSIEQVADKQWTLALLRALEGQIPLYAQLAEDKNFLFMCMSVVLCKLDMDHVISESCELIFQSASHDVPIEQEGCAMALGRISSNHLQVVFDVLSKEHRKLETVFLHAGRTGKVQSLFMVSGTGGSVTTPTTASLSGNTRRFSNLFRSGSSTVSKVGSPPRSIEKPVDHNYRGSVEQAKASLLWAYAQTIHSIPVSNLSELVECMINTIVSPTAECVENATCIQLAVAGLIGSIAKVLKRHADASQPAALSTDYLIESRAGLLYSLLRLLCHHTPTPDGDEAPVEVNVHTVLPFKLPPDSVTRPCVINITGAQVCCAVMLVALDVFSIYTVNYSSDLLEQLLRATAALLSSVPPLQEEMNVTSPSRNLSSGFQSSSSEVLSSSDATVQRFLPSRIVLAVPPSIWYSYCLTTLQLLWTTVLRVSGCSDLLISSMFKILIPYMHDTSAHTTIRSLRLLMAVLSTVLSELHLVTNESTYSLRAMGATPSLTGQLVGHLVALLGRAHCSTVRRETKACLRQLLHIQRLFVADVEAVDSVNTGFDADGADVLDSPTIQLLSSDLLLCELAHGVPQTQLRALLELIYSGLILPPIVPITGDSSDMTDDCDDDGCVEPSNAITNTRLTRDGRSWNYLWKMCGNKWSSRCSGPQGPSYVAVEKSQSELPAWFLRLGIPWSSQGFLLKLLIGLVYGHAGVLNDQQVEFIVRSAHRIYPQLPQPGLRAGLLHAVAQLGYRWPLLCLKIISANNLPLDDTWCILLSAIAFLPVSKSSCAALAGFDSQPATPEGKTDQGRTHSQLDSMDAADGHLYPRLLLHILKLLDCCHPYETRDIPLEAATSADKRFLATTAGDGPSMLEANFATQFWLSLVNCLQILSYPISMDELVNGSGPYASHRYSTRPNTIMTTKSRRKLFSRSITLPMSDKILSDLPTPVAQQSDACMLTTFLIDPPLFTRMLGHWLLAYATTAVCRTLTGKSYETRSGAEANLELGRRPVTIAIEGINRFVQACCLSGLRFSSTQTPKALNSVAKSQSSEVSGNFTAENSILDNPDNLPEIVNITVCFVTKLLHKEYVFGLVQFFLGHMNSTYEVRRKLAVMVIGTVLSQLHMISDDSNITNILTIRPFNPDMLLEQLIRRLNDSSYAIRLLTIQMIGNIPAVAVNAQNACCSPRQSSDSHPDASPVNDTDVEDVRLILIRCQSTTIIQRLMEIVNEHEGSDDSILLASFECLNHILPCATERQLYALLSDLSLRLLPIYSSVSVAIRSAAFRLFGTMTNFAWDTSVSKPNMRYPTASYEILRAEANSVFVPLTLHLADPAESLVQVCKVTLKSVAPLLFLPSNPSDPKSNAVVTPDHMHTSSNKSEFGASRLVEFLQNCLSTSTRLHHGEFYNELARLLVSCCPERALDYCMRCTVYFQSDSPELQCSALLFSSFLIAHFTSDMFGQFSVVRIGQEFLQLLKSNHPEVRATAAHAISRLNRF